MTTAKIIDAASGHLDDLADVIGDAFASLDVSRYLIPDDTARRDILTRHLGLLVKHAELYGRVLTDSDLNSVAVWLPGGSANAVPDIPDYDQIRAQACGPHTERMSWFEALMVQHHPTGPQHWHLALLAVRPRRQGDGLGSALLRHQHEWLDDRRLPAYLEASSPRSRALYLRHGYLQIGPESYPIGRDGSGPRMFPLWRVAGAPERHPVRSHS